MTGDGTRTDVISVERATKTFGEIVAVNDVSFHVGSGEVFGLLGPNGAGKTTTLDCLAGLKRVDRGNVCVFGQDAWRHRHAIRQRIGVQLQESRLQARIKVWEALDLFSSFYERPLDYEQLLEPLGLVDKRDALYGDLSGGQKQRLFVALAMVGDGELLFLDELTTGLDPQARHAMWDLVRAVRDRGRTIVLTTHFMEEAERLCDRVAIMDVGRIAAVGSPDELIRGDGADTRIAFTAAARIDATRLEHLASVARVEENDDRVTVHGSGERLLAEVTRALDDMGCGYHDLRSERTTLEDVFLSLTGHTLRGQT